jgi:hypothetical protein
MQQIFALLVFFVFAGALSSPDESAAGDEPARMSFLIATSTNFTKSPISTFSRTKKKAPLAEIASSQEALLQNPKANLC